MTEASAVKPRNHVWKRVGRAWGDLITSAFDDTRYDACANCLAIRRTRVKEGVWNDKVSVSYAQRLKGPWRLKAGRCGAESTSTLTEP